MAPLWALERPFKPPVSPRVLHMLGMHVPHDVYACWTMGQMQRVKQVCLPVMKVTFPVREGVRLGEVTCLLQ